MAFVSNFPTQAFSTISHITGHTIMLIQRRLVLGLSIIDSLAHHGLRLFPRYG
jgi:hypothetical protein